MIQTLAERLVDIDLLNRAAELLQHQVKFRLKGVDRAVVGAKLALIQLLDSTNPTGAIEALRMTAYPRLPEELDDDRRRIQARAFFETGRPDEAIELLAGDVSRNADLLRADINWRTENWAEAAKSLQRMAGQPPDEGTTFDRERVPDNFELGRGDALEQGRKRTCGVAGTLWAGDDGQPARQTRFSSLPAHPTRLSRWTWTR